MVELSRGRRLSFFPLVCVIFFTVSGGAGSNHTNALLSSISSSAIARSCDIETTGPVDLCAFETEGVK